MSKLRA
jgi:hypothetical protein